MMIAQEHMIKHKRKSQKQIYEKKVGNKGY
jgi:hypothetical protein